MMFTFDNFLSRQNDYLFDLVVTTNGSSVQAIVPTDDGTEEFLMSCNDSGMDVFTVPGFQKAGVVNVVGSTSVNKGALLAEVPDEKLHAIYIKVRAVAVDKLEARNAPEQENTDTPLNPAEELSILINDLQNETEQEVCPKFRSTYNKDEYIIKARGMFYDVRHLETNGAHRVDVLAPTGGDVIASIMYFYADMFISKCIDDIEMPETVTRKIVNLVNW